MKLHAEVSVPDVESIKTQALIIIKHALETLGHDFNDPETSKKLLFVRLPDNIKIFLEIPELKSFLDNNRWTNYITGIMFNTAPPNTTGLIHIDPPWTNKSFNIPIIGYESSFVNFYRIKNNVSKHTEIEPNVTSGSITFSAFNPDDVEFIEQYQTLGPHIVKIDGPHQIVNSSSSIRINLLIRLSHELDISQHYV